MREETNGRSEKKGNQQLRLSNPSIRRRIFAQESLYLCRTQYRCRSNRKKWVQSSRSADSSRISREEDSSLLSAPCPPPTSSLGLSISPLNLVESLTQSGSIAILASGPVRLLSLSLPRSEKSLAPNRRANSSILEKLPALPFSDLSTSIVLKSRHPNSSRILSAALRFSPLPRSPPCLASYLPLLAVLAHSTFHPPFPSRQPPNFESACSTFFPLNSFAKSSNRLYLRPSTQ